MMNPVIVTASATAVLACCALAVSEKPTVKKYTVTSPKISEKVRILHISDLHASRYGEGQKKLIALTDEIAPDMIALTGDIADNRKSNRDTFAYTGYIGKKYPCYYVDGNHEVYTGRQKTIKKRFSDQGLRILEGNTEKIVLNGNALTVGGVDDPYDNKDGLGRTWEEELSGCNADIDESRFSLLLSHRPEKVSEYEKTDFDLILSGHAHGGQVIIPGLVNGLYAPHQGVFPKYAGGKFVLSNGSTMIVSRGLSTYVRPRVFNRPELVLIELVGK